MDAATSQTIERELAEALLQIHEDSYGKGAASVRVLTADDAIVVFFDGLELQQNEEFLIENGHGASVVAQRGEFQQAIGPVYHAAVERVTGQTVTSFASVTKLNPHYAVEIFRLTGTGAPSVKRLRRRSE